MEIIKCVLCKEEKSDNEFSFWRGRRNKACKDCREKNNEWYAKDLDGRRTRQRKWYKENRYKTKKYRFELRLDRKYSMSKEDWGKMLSNQNNKCAICERSFEGIKPCVDHNHDTGKVRALLCRKCNLNLHAIENKEYLKKAILYLRKYMK